MRCDVCKECGDLLEDYKGYCPNIQEVIKETAARCVEIAGFECKITRHYTLAEKIENHISEEFNLAEKIENHISEEFNLRF